MKTYKIALFAVSFFYLILSACSKGSDTTDHATDNYIPNLSAAGWQNLSDVNDNLFFFDTPPVGSASGTFNGNRNLNGVTEAFTGSFNHSAIQIQFTAGTFNGRAFSGTINGNVNPVTITISSPASGTNPAVTLTYKKS